MKKEDQDDEPQNSNNVPTQASRWQKLQNRSQKMYESID